MEATKNNNLLVQFEELDYGTRVTSSSLEVVEVKVNPDIILDSYAEAYADELMRLNPTRFKQDPILAEELKYYFTSLLYLRIAIVKGDRSQIRLVKQLMIPDWIQYTISKIGVVRDLIRGLKFEPMMESLNIEAAVLLKTSERLSFYVQDGLHCRQNAFPLMLEGDINVMGMVILNDFVVSCNTERTQPVSSYVAAFVGLKLVEEQVFQSLFKVRYDEVKLIKEWIIHDRKLR